MKAMKLDDAKKAELQATFPQGCQVEVIDENAGYYGRKGEVLDYGADGSIKVKVQARLGERTDFFLPEELKRV